MGEIVKYSCDFCDFEYADDNAIFYFSKDLTTYNESMFLMKTGIKINKSPLSGPIYLAYCRDCDEFIKIYAVKTNETDLSKEEIEKLILDNAFDDFGAGSSFFAEYESDVVLNYLKENDFKKIVVFDDSCDSIDCSGCGKHLDIIKNQVQCPKCGFGMIMGFVGVSVD